MAATAQAILQVKAQGAAQTNQEFQNLRKNITGNMSAAEKSVASSLSSMAAQYISLGLVIRQVGKTLSQGVEFNKFIENQTMAFEVMMKSADKAKAKVKELYDFAVESPLTFKETVSSSKQLMAYGFVAEELVPTMEKLGTVSIATGHSLSDIAYVYGTLKSQGRAYSRDLMQFGMRGIPIYEELAKVLKVDVGMIQKMASEGKIGFKEVEKAFANMTEEGGRFGGILEKYMETLTGKIAMLSDIWEQSTGKMAEGINKVLGRAVDDLTAKLESGELDGFIEDMSTNVAGLAQALISVAKVLVDIAPLLMTIAKIWISMKVGGGIVKGLAGMFTGFVNLSESLSLLSVKLQSFTTLLYSLPMIMKANIASINLFKDAIVGLLNAISANPIGLALLGMATMGTAIAGVVAQLTKNSRDLKKEVGAIAEADSDGRVDLLDKRFKQLADEFAIINESGGFMLDTSDIDYFVERFGVAKAKVEELAVAYKLLDATMVDSVHAIAIQETESEKYRKTRAGDVSLPKSPAEKQADFFSSLTGADAAHYLDSEIALFSALGGRAADEYIKAFENARDSKKDVLKDLYLPDDYKKDLQDEYKELEASLIAAGLEIPEALNSADKKYGTTFGDIMLARMRQINKELEDGGKKVEKTYASLEDTLKALGKWWLPEEARVKATQDAFDDLSLEYKKALFNAQSEADAREATINLMEDGADKTRLLLELDMQRKQIAEDTLAYFEQQGIALRRQKDLDVYDKQLSGDPAYWEDIKIAASKGDMSGVPMLAAEGTQIGSAIAGADPMIMAIKAIADFAMSIENVSKLMSPLTTILEAGRPLFELFINSALQDMVNQLSALGVIIGKILAPFLSLTQLVLLFSNTLFTLVLLPLELLGTGFAWFNDHVIAPAGNTIIDLINTFIGWINKYTTASLPYITSIKKTTEANETYTKALKDAVSNATNALTGTISFLLDKFNSYIDEQVNSYQDLYEVGAISGEEYEKMVSALDNKLDPGSVNISDKDKALEGQGAIAARLMQLYGVQNQLDSGDLSEEQQLQLLMSAGLNTQSTTQLMMREAFEAAMKNVGVSTESTDIDSALKNVREIQTLQTGVTGIPHNVNSSWDKVKDAAISMWSSIKTTASGIWDSVKTTASGIWSGVKTTASGIWSGVKTTASGIWSGVQTTAKGIWSGVQTSAKGIWSGVQTTAKGIWDSIKTAAAAPWKSVGNGIIDIFNSIITALNKLPLFNLSYLPKLAVGTPNVPFDMFAQIHQGEAVIPKTFMDGVRSGELSIGSSNNNGNNYYVTVNVEGNVTAEKDLAVSIAEVLYTERRAGRVAV